MAGLLQCQTRVAGLLMPYGLFLQRHTLEDDAYQGFPIEPGLLAIAGIAVATFCHAFLKEFGAETGRAAGKKVAAWLHDLVASTDDRQPTQAHCSEEDMENIARAVQDTAEKLEPSAYIRFRVGRMQHIQTTLTDKGLPSRRSEPLACEIVKLIELELGLRNTSAEEH